MNANLARFLLYARLVGRPAPGSRRARDAVPAPRALHVGLVGCRRCGSVWESATEGEPCGRCGTPLLTRKRDSLRRTWAFLLAACALYLPANLLPVMTTRSLFGTQNDTILSGIIYFWIDGSYGLAAIIFIASFLVPLFKLAALFVLVLGAQRRSHWRRGERARLYHVIELIGRWSMLDVFVVALLAGLVRIQGFAEITAGMGIAAFGLVVVLTMLASLSFDPKLTWDIAPGLPDDDADDADDPSADNAPNGLDTNPALAPPTTPS
jgi:paraquat-inducible protein A